MRSHSYASMGVLQDGFYLYFEALRAPLILTKSLFAEMQLRTVKEPPPIFTAANYLTYKLPSASAKYFRY